MTCRRRLINYYLDDVYGNEITVVRTINANSGASTYKLKSDKGKIICSSRQDLNKLTLCLNIQVENPVLILNQDAARSFLKECDPKKLYTFFLKATQIETIVDKLHSCLKDATSSKAQLENLDRNMVHQKAEIVVIKERQEKLRSINRLRIEISELKNEKNWLKVVESEKVRDEIEKKLMDTQQKIKEIDDFIKNRSKNDKSLKDKIRDDGTELANLIELLNDKNKAADEARAEFEKHNDVYSTTESTDRSMVERLKLVEQNVSQLRADIDERESNPLNVANLRKENEGMIQVLEKKIGDLTLILKNALRDHGQFAETLSDSLETIESETTMFSKIQGSSQSCTNQIRQLQGAKQHALSAYGNSMSKLVSRIEDMDKKKRFAEKPRGPLGRYIEVPDKKYKVTVENILDRTLVSFFVSCDKDRILLTQLLKDFPDLSSTPIITGAFHHQAYDVRNGMVRMDGRAGCVLMDVIKVSDPVVMNCLIDQKRVESIVLVENTDDAIELTQNIEDVPQNLFRVVMLKPLSEYYPAPKYRTYGMHEKPARYIQTNNKELIAGIEKQKQGFEERLRQISVTIKKSEADVAEKTKLVKDKKKLIDELRQKERQYQQQMNELKSVEYPAEDEIEYLRKELDTLTKKQEGFERKIGESKQKLEEGRAVSTKLENKTKTCREEAREARNKMTGLQAEIENIQQQLRDMGNEIKLKQNELNDLKLIDNDTKDQLDEAQETVQALIVNCEQARVDPQHSEQDILLKIKTNESRIQKIEASNDNIADVELLLANKTQQLEKMSQIRTVLDKALKKVS